MIKVLLVISSLNIGGAETLVKNYLLNFDRKKIDATLLCLEHAGNSMYEMELDKNGVKVIYASKKMFNGSSNIFLKLMRRLRRYFVARRIIKAEKPDVIHGHLFVNDYIKFAHPAKKTAIFYSVHSDPKKLWEMDKIGCRRDFAAAKWLVKKYDMKFITLHCDMQKEINKMFDVDDSLLLNNGIDLVKYGNRGDGKAIRKEVGIPKSAFVLGHVGRFSDVKNQSFLVEIAKEIKDSFLLMVGDGPEKEKIQNQIRAAKLNHRCLILSDRNDIPELMSAMDVFVFPSLYEGMPLALIEAQEMRLPCFISNTISRYAIISNLVMDLPLNLGAKKWGEIIKKYKRPVKDRVSDAEWDIKKVVKELEQFYLDALDESDVLMVTMSGRT